MRWKTCHRVTAVCVAAGIVFTIFSLELVHLQIGKHEEYSRLAAEKHAIKQPIYAKRGLIRDRNGEILAANLPIRKVILDGSHVNNADALARLAAPYLGIPEDELRQKFQTGKKYVVIERELDEEKAYALRREMADASLRGLYFLESSRRVYPNGRMLAHVLGFLSRKDPQDDHVVGVEGIERTLEEELRGEDGFRHIERDRTGSEIVVYRGQEQPPRQGETAELTIDMGLQSIVEEELDTAWAELKPNTAVAIMVEPHSGEILAMATRPNFDPNNLVAAKVEEMKNRAIMDVIEPGSTFKIVVTSAALTERVVNDKTQIYCENGRFAYGGKILRDHHGYGQMGVSDIIIKSSNIGCAKLALKLGEDRFYSYVRSFGFGERTGVALPGEVPGILSPPSRWDKLTITRIPMGQAIAVTPLQITMAMATIANGGQLMKPLIVRRLRDDQGRDVAVIAPEVVRRVIPTDTAHFLNAALTGVTGLGGTARLAAVPGYSVAGKTGTAQKVSPKGGYADGKYVASFVGYLPAENPAFVCLVMVDDAKVPSNLNYGGLVAAPVFERIGTRAARYLNLVPTLQAESVLPLAKGGPPEGRKEARR